MTRINKTSFEILAVVKRTIFKFLFTTLISIAMLISFSAKALSGGEIVYHGQLIDPNGDPVSASLVQFRIQIRTPGPENCLMYEEVQTKDLTASGGFFAITLNDGSGIRTDLSGYDIDRIFANRGTFNFSSGQCAAGTDYTPAGPSEGRTIRLYFNDGTFSGWEAMPVQKINFVPMAIEAQQVGGFHRDTLLRVEDPTTGPQSVSSLTPAHFSSLMDLINGVSTQYMKSSAAGISLPAASSDPSSPVAGQMWYSSASNEIKYYDGTSVKTLGSSTGFTGSLGGDVTGTQGSTSVERLRGRTVTASAPSDGQVLLWDDGSLAWKPQYVRMKDIRNEWGANQMIPDPLCSAAQSMVWSVVTDRFTCQNIGSLPWAALSAGVLPVDRLPALTGDVSSSAGSNSLTLNTVAIAKGGTGLTSAGTANQILGMKSDASGMEYKSLTAGSGVSITHSAGGVEIAANLNGYVAKSGDTMSGSLDITGNLHTSGQIYTNQNVISSGATVNFNSGNTQILENVGGTDITLDNMRDGGSYLLIVTDPASRQYTFTNCTNVKFNPPNSTTTLNTTTIYNIVKTTLASTTYCFISWSTGYQ